MKTNELIELLSKYPNKEVVIRPDNGLFCPITAVKLFAECLIIESTSPETFAETEDFKPLEFGKSVEKIYIIDNDK